MKRKEALATGEVYHVFNKSIAGYKIFNNDSEFLRMINVICYYQRENPGLKFSDFIRSAAVKNNHFPPQGCNHFPPLGWEMGDKEKLVEIIAYCVMPTHLHLAVKQLKENGISIFMGNVLNSYAKYFNTKHERKGPLWEGKFQNLLVETDEYLLHLTRYIHLNPPTARLVDKPEDWLVSSYREYLLSTDNTRICKYEDILDIEPKDYKEFVEDRISYQRDLAKIKHLLIDVDEEQLQPSPTS